MLAHVRVVNGDLIIVVVLPVLGTTSVLLLFGKFYLEHPLVLDNAIFGNTETERPI